MLEKTLESLLDSKEIKEVNPKWNQPWIFTGRTDAEAEALLLCPPDAKSQLIGKDPVAGKDRGQEEKGATDSGTAHSFFPITLPTYSAHFTERKRKAIDLALRKLMSSLVTFFPQITLTGCKLAVCGVNLTGRWLLFGTILQIMFFGKSPALQVFLQSENWEHFSTWPQLAEPLGAGSLVYHSPLHCVFSKWAQVCPLDIPTGPESVNCSVMSGFFRLLCSWDFAAKNTGVDCYFLLQGILVTPGIKFR